MNGPPGLPGDRAGERVVTVPRATPDSAESAWALAAATAPFHASTHLGFCIAFHPQAHPTAHAVVVFHEVLQPGSAETPPSFGRSQASVAPQPRQQHCWVSTTCRRAPPQPVHCCPVPRRHLATATSRGCVAPMGQGASMEDAFGRLEELDQMKMEAIQRMKDLEPEAAAEEAAGVAPTRGSKQDLHHAACQHRNLLYAESSAVNEHIRGCRQHCQPLLHACPAHVPAAQTQQAQTGAQPIVPLPAASINTCMRSSRARMLPLLGIQRSFLAPDHLCCSRLPLQLLSCKLATTGGGGQG